MSKTRKANGSAIRAGASEADANTATPAPEEAGETGGSSGESRRGGTGRAPGGDEMTEAQARDLLASAVAADVVGEEALDPDNPSPRVARAMRLLHETPESVRIRLDHHRLDARLRERNEMARLAYGAVREAVAEADEAAADMMRSASEMAEAVASKRRAAIIRSIGLDTETGSDDELRDAERRLRSDYADVVRQLTKHEEHEKRRRAEEEAVRLRLVTLRRTVASHLERARKGREELEEEKRRLIERARVSAGLALRQETAGESA